MLVFTTQVELVGLMSQTVCKTPDQLSSQLVGQNLQLPDTLRFLTAGNTASDLTNAVDQVHVHGRGSSAPHVLPMGPGPG